MKKIWITGSSGFIGQHLASAAAAEGSSVSGIDIVAVPPGTEKNGVINNFVCGSVTAETLNALMRASGTPDEIYHLAGGSSVGFSVQFPYEDFERSTGSTAHVLEWIRTVSPKTAIVFVSSAAVYGENHHAPISEHAPPSPFSPYGYTKYMSELLIESYSKNFGIRSSVIRLFSVYGNGLRKQLLWDVCSKFSSRSQKVSLFGTGDEQRDWLHISDAAAMILHAARHACVGCCTVNGGTGLSVSIRDIVDEVRQQWSSPAETIFNGEQRAGDPVYLVADTMKGKELGFSAAVPWREGVAGYVRWFKGVHENN